MPRNVSNIKEVVSSKLELSTDRKVGKLSINIESKSVAILKRVSSIIFFLKSLPRHDIIMYRFTASFCPFILLIAIQNISSLSNVVYEEGICERKTYDVNLPVIARAKNFDELLLLGNAFADKSLLVKEIFSRPEKIFVVTAPRAWGKTMNLDMFRMFVELEGDRSGLLLAPTETQAYRFFHYGHVKSPTGTSVIFKSPPLISKYPEILEQHLGKYPIISLRLDIDEYPSYDQVLALFKKKISEEFVRYRLTKRYSVEDDEKFQRIASNNETDVAQIKQSLKFLCKIIHQNYAKRVIILIDDFDGALNYVLEPWRFINIVKVIKKKVINLYAAIFLQTFNDNEYLEKALVIGNMMGCPEALFSKLSHVALFDVMTNQFNRFFGFTRREVDSFFELAEISSDLAQKAHQWYYGYNMNRDDRLIVYNPWDIAIFLLKEETWNWWENSANDDSIRMLLKFPDMYHFNMQLASLKNASVCFQNAHMSEKDVDHLDFLILRNETARTNNYDIDIIVKRLCSAGYVTFAGYFVNYVGNVNMTQIRVPNQAIRSEFHRIIPNIKKNENDTVGLFF